MNGNSDDNLELKDTQGRNATQLLDIAEIVRSVNLAESVVLGYLALKASKVEKNTAIEARSHLFLSETLSKFGYRAMERIHAKIAYRVMNRNNSSSSKLDQGPFYYRLGIVAKDSGDYSIAEFYLKKALVTLDSEDKRNRNAIVSTLLELAKLSLKRAQIQYKLEQDSHEQLKNAQKYIDQAMTLTENATDKKELEGKILDVQAQMILRMSGHLPQENRKLKKEILANAEKMIRESLNKHQLNSPQDLYQTLPIMNDLVSVLRRTSRYVEAMDTVEDILDITDRLQRVNVDTVLNMVLVAKNLSDEQQIRTLCNIVMNSEESSIAEVSSKSSEALALAYSAQSRYRSMICLAILSTLNMTDNKNSRLILDLVLRRKAMVSESEGSFWDTLHARTEEDLSEARSKLVHLRNLLSTKVVAGDGVGLWQLIQEIESGEELLSVEPWWRDFQSESKKEERKALKSYAQSLLEGMSSWEAISAQKHQFDDQRVTIDTVEKSIPSDTVLVEFAKIDDFDLEREVFSGKAEYWAFVLNSDGETRTVKLGDASDIDTKITANLSTLLTVDRLLVEPQLKAMSTLYDIVWAPLVDQLGNQKNIIISPDSIFALVPFSALLTKDDSFLIEDYTLYQIATGRELVVREQEQLRKSSRPTIIADPNFDAHLIQDSVDHQLKNGRVISHKPLSRLESTIDEAIKVRELLGNDVEFITDVDASERNVRLVKSPRVLHIATHGLFLEEIARTEQDLSEADSAALESAYVQHVQSLSLSGLAFSGFNHGGLGEGDDGLLTAFDVAGMDLTGTELVVLSACDTGLGNVVVGEGVLGLRRAFGIAGAQCVLMSLWQLSDREAVRQMRTFYKAYSTGENPVIALRDTQRARIARLREVLGYAPPSLWGALTIQGIYKLQPTDGIGTGKVRDR